MDTYMHHLIHEIKNAHREQLTNEGSDREITFEEEMEIIEDYATGRNIPPSLSKKTGLTMDQFPHVEGLTDQEIEEVINCLHELYSSWHISADYPSNLPARRAYSLLVNILNEEAWYFPTGTLHFDFCTGYAPGCELEEYCPCLEHWDKKSGN